METIDDMNIFLIGSGNVATQLGKVFKKCGHKIVFIYSPNILHAKKLGRVLKCNCSNSLKAIQYFPADIYLIAIKDDAIKTIVNQMPIIKDKLVVHTSGAADIAILRRKFKNCGVLWFPQTIQQKDRVSFKNIPVIIEGSNPYAEKILKKLANDLSNSVYRLNSKQRKILHLGAVWVNNFTNHLYLIAQYILKKHNLPFELLHPLILYTARKGIKNPHLAQTGPAKRNDKITMATHLRLLPNKHYKALYKSISASILKTTRNKL